MTAPENGTPPIQAQLTITLYENGDGNINGPIENRLLCYGMLEIGKEMLVAHAERLAKMKSAAPKIQVVPDGVVPPFKPRLG